MFDAFKPGQTVRCTVVKEPLRDDDRQTIARLMRQDPAIRAKLNSAQERRKRDMQWGTRGGRPWPMRPRAARYANVYKDASWSMRYVPHIAPDFNAISEFVKVESA